MVQFRIIYNAIYYLVSGTSPIYVFRLPGPQISVRCLPRHRALCFPLIIVLVQVIKANLQVSPKRRMQRLVERKCDVFNEPCLALVAVCAFPITEHRHRKPSLFLNIPLTKELFNHKSTPDLVQFPAFGGMPNISSFNSDLVQIKAALRASEGQRFRLKLT